MPARFPDDPITADAWRCARLRRLESSPFTADRLAQYAALCHEPLNVPTAFLYLFHKNRTLLSRSILFSGLEKEPLDYCPSLPDIFARTGAASLGISLTTAGERITETDIVRLSRIVLFCEQNRLPLLEAILVSPEEAVPLCRASGGTEFSILHSRKDQYNG